MPFQDWLDRLKDQVAIARIRARLDRVRAGNFGDIKSLGGGVEEIRFSFGPGFRIYFGVDRGALVILLIGGDKSSQARDIKRAHEYWDDYQRRAKK